jgi:hypothetical protein
LPEEALAVDLTARVVEVATSARAAELLGPSTETDRRLEATPHRADRAESAPAPTVVTTMADRPRAIPHAGAPVWAVVEGDLVAAVAAAEHRMVAGVDVVSPSPR